MTSLVGDSLDILVERLVHDINSHSRFHGDVGDLGDHLLGAEELEDALVDAHLEAIVSVGTFTTRRLANHQSELLGRHAHRAVHTHRLVLLIASAYKVRLAEGLVLQICAYLLHGLNVLGGERNADTADLRLVSDVHLL